MRIGAQQSTGLLKNVLVTFLSGSEEHVGTWARLCQDGVHVCTGTHVRGTKGSRSRGLKTLAVHGRWGRSLDDPQTLGPSASRTRRLCRHLLWRHQLLHCCGTSHEGVWGPPSHPPTT